MLFCTAYNETLAAGQRNYSMAAEVGLLTRNVRVIGGAYDRQMTESYGARILVGSAADADHVYNGNLSA